MHRKIAQITDLHLDEAFPREKGIAARKRFQTIVQDIEKKGISEIICTGDIGEKEGIAYFFEQLQTPSLSITLGNHDSFAEILKHFSKGVKKDTQKLYSRHEYQYFKFLYLDSSASKIDKKQLYWLEKELVSSKPILIFIHHPILGLNLKVDEIGQLKNRVGILQLLEKCTQKITIFCGHYHMESTLIYQNITQFITPAVSFQIKEHISEIEIDTTVYGYRIIELKKDNISSEIKWLKDAN